MFLLASTQQKDMKVLPLWLLLQIAHQVSLIPPRLAPPPPPPPPPLPPTLPPRLRPQVH